MLTVLPRFIPLDLSTYSEPSHKPPGGPRYDLYRSRSKQLKDSNASKATSEGKRTTKLLMGGPTAKRKVFLISLAKQGTDKLNRYREPKGNTAIGVIWERLVFPTGIHQWTIQHRCKPNELKKPVA